jgi:hypothetical protein
MGYLLFLQSLLRGKGGPETAVGAGLALLFASGASMLSSAGCARPERG